MPRALYTFFFLLCSVSVIKKLSSWAIDFYIAPWIVVARINKRIVIYIKSRRRQCRNYRPLLNVRGIHTPIWCIDNITFDVVCVSPFTQGCPPAFSREGWRICMQTIWALRFHKVIHRDSHSQRNSVDLFLPVRRAFVVLA